MSGYEPELGQMVYGQPWQRYQCPEWMLAFLNYIADELSRVMENIAQESMYETPFDNYGSRFECDTFAVEAYSWDEDTEQPWNFKWGDVEVSWYKYLGRGTSINQELTPERGIEMLDDCLAAIRRYEQEHDV